MGICDVLLRDKATDSGHESLPSKSRETSKCLCGFPLNNDQILVKKYWYASF